ncbi:MAG: hypothetical protein L0332_03345 [Chloroflexi bacterium]|nr:hypothetical protein [Chloroflexota bacterium]MCI0579669.1 hypothetical protein [Chloroflexota bacterium]MCI0645891.1 hypothetical protein [Chloroflexota bacterium]MCI0725746.1 hypothetical protein [Chloroflexota bacterium]
MAGGALVVTSLEIDRFREIAAAKAALDKAQRELDQAYNDFYNKLGRCIRCKSHYAQKGAKK